MSAPPIKAVISAAEDLAELARMQRTVGGSSAVGQEISEALEDKKQLLKEQLAKVEAFHSEAGTPKEQAKLAAQRAAWHLTSP